MRGQVNATQTHVLDDGTPMNRSSTSVIECVHEEALPLVEMEPGVFQTQWVANVRCLTNIVIELGDRNSAARTTQFEQTIENLSQVIWTVIIKEIDTDGDGIPDEVFISGSSTTLDLGTTTDGAVPDGTPPLPPLPPLVVPYEFEGVLENSAIE